MSSDRSPIDGASIVVYKSMGLANSADKNPGYSASIATASDGSFELRNIPSGVYKITVTQPNGGNVQTIDN
jgi:Carboxypeptidase regulatory-like domain